MKYDNTELGISPAPWRNDFCAIRSTYNTDEVWCIADLNHWLPSGDREANSNLIAQSPELFDCLAQAVREKCGRCKYCIDDKCQTPMGDNEPCYVRRWRKALKRAAGEDE